MSNPDVLGWLAAGLMVATFGCREARAMRPLAVATNVAFIGYGMAASLVPVLTLHLLLLPINLWRWAECRRLARGHGMDFAGFRSRSLPMLIVACALLAGCVGDRPF
jgi:hypothetical protein